MNFFLKLLDKNSPKSSGRFLSIVTVITILYTWAWVSLFTRSIVDIPTGVYTFAAVVVGGKTLGMFADVMGNSKPGTTTTVETASKTTTGEST